MQRRASAAGPRHELGPVRGLALGFAGGIAAWLLIAALVLAVLVV